MEEIKLKYYKVKFLPSITKPNSVYYVKGENEEFVRSYITGKDCVPYPLLDETSALVATEWSPNHSSATGNPYTVGTYVFWEGHIYKCKFENNGLSTTDANYWLDLGEGFLLEEEQSDWDAVTGRPFIRNKPTNTSDFNNDGEDGFYPFITLEDIPASILSALPFTTDHLSTTNNQYVVGDVVWYLGNVHRCIANNDSILPTATSYWTNIGPGYPIVQQPADWDSSSGNNQILNKPTIPAPLGYTPVNVAGDTMLGTLVLNADPINSLDAATKQYVDKIEEHTYAEYVALINDNALLPERYYALIDYQHKYYVEESNTSLKKVYGTVSDVNSGWIIDSDYQYDLNVGMTVTITSLPLGYTGTLQVGQTTTVTNTYVNYYFQFANGMHSQLNGVGVGLSWSYTRYTLNTGLNNATVYDTYGKIIMQPNGLVNTTVHDGTAYGNLTAAENFTPPIEKIVLKAKSTNSFYENCYSLTYLNDELIYDFNDTIIYNDNIDSIGTRNGFIKRRFNKVLNIDLPKDWRVQRYRRWLIPPATVGSDYRKKLINQDYPNTNLYLAFQNKYIFTSEYMTVNSLDNMYICTTPEYSTLTAGITGSSVSYPITITGFTGGIGSTEDIVNFKDYTIFELDLSLNPFEVERCEIEEFNNTVFINTDSTIKEDLFISVSVNSSIYDSTFFGYPKLTGISTSFTEINTFDRVEIKGDHNTFIEINMLGYGQISSDNSYFKKLIFGSLPFYVWFGNMGPTAPDSVTGTPARWFYLASSISSIQNCLIGVGYSIFTFSNSKINGGSIFNYAAVTNELGNIAPSYSILNTELTNTNYHNYYSQILTTNNTSLSSKLIRISQSLLTTGVLEVILQSDVNSALYYQNLDIATPANTVTKKYNYTTYLFETVSNPGGGTVTGVTATSPILSSGGIAPVISHSTADGNLHVPATGTTNNGKVLTAGATAGSFSWSAINGNVVVQKTKAEIDTLISNNDLIPLTVYLITGVDPTLYGGTDIYIQAITDNTLSFEGIGKFYNPKYNQAVVGFDVWTPNGSYTVGDKIHWGGRTWINVNAVTGTSIDLFNLDIDWTVIPFNDTEYNVAYDVIKYDYANDVIVYRNEQNSNIVSTSYENIQEFLDYNSGIGTPIKSFMWGNVFNFNLNKGIGNQVITNSYNENINFRGLYQTYLIFNNISYQINLNFDNNSYQSYLTFNNSYQSNLTFDNSYQSNLTFNNFSRQSNLTFDNNSRQSNLTFDNTSAQTNLTFNNFSRQENLTFYNSYQDYLTFNNFSHQTNLTFDNNSYQFNLTFDNSSYQINLTFDNSSRQIYLTETTGFYQNKIHFINYQFDRTLDPITTNEEDLMFQGDLPISTTATKMIVKEDNQLKEMDIQSGPQGPAGPAGANGISSGQIYYFNNSITFDNDYKLIDKLPTTATQQSILKTTNGQTPVLVQQFITSQLGVTVIPPGVQRFHLHFLKQAINNQTECYAEIQLADIDSVLYGSVLTTNVALIGFIDSVTPIEVYLDLVIPQSFFIQASDRMVVRLFVKDSGTSSRDVTWFTEGTTNYSYVVTSLGVEGGATDLNYTPSPSNGTVTSSTGSSATLPLADGTNAGLLTPAKFTVLENTSGTNTGDQDLSSLAPKASPTFTGTVVLPSTTSIGNVSSTEIGYLDNVTSSIQTQLDNKLAKNVGDDYTTNFIRTVTLADYNAIVTKDATTLYFII